MTDQSGEHTPDVPLARREVTAEAVAQAIAERGHLLSPERRRLLAIRWGFNDGRGKSLEETSVILDLGWNRERCRQNEYDSLRLLGLKHP